MKRIIVFVMVVLCGWQLSAQDETVFNRTKRVGIFVSPFIEQGPLNEPWRTSLGGGFGVVLGDAFAGFYGLAGLDYDQLFLDENLERIDLAHGGFWFGYTPMQNRMLHPYASLKMGWGGVDINLDELDQNDINELPFTIDDSDGVDNVFVLSPELGMELNVASFLRFFVTGGYRWVEGINSPALEEDDFNGFTGTFGIRLGWFGKERRRGRAF